MAETQWIVGDYLYLSQGRRLKCPDGKWKKLNPKTARLLEVFLTHPGQMLSYSRLLQLAWDDRVVTHFAVRRVVADLRKAFRDDHKAPEFLLTGQNQGYMWLVAPEASEVVAPLQTAVPPWRKIGLALLLMVMMLLVWQMGRVDRGRVQLPEQAIREWPRFSHQPDLLPEQYGCLAQSE